MAFDASPRWQLFPAIATAFTIAAIAIVLLACSPPRDANPPTPQSTIAAIALGRSA
jgi:hypothetical protein